MRANFFYYTNIRMADIPVKGMPAVYLFIEPYLLRAKVFDNFRKIRINKYCIWYLCSIVHQSRNQNGALSFPAVFLVIFDI